jgi:hypothetical protein
MIDWWALGHNALWVVGLALGLAVLSVANYQAHREAVRLRDKLNQAGAQLALDAGLALFCLGLLFSGRAWWEYAAWGLLTVAFAAHAAIRATSGRSAGDGADSERDSVVAHVPRTDR